MCTRLLGCIPADKRALYASGALVVLIVAVIILLAARPAPRILDALPKGLKTVAVLDTPRYLGGPLFAALQAAEHPAAKALDPLEERCDLNFRRDVTRLVTTDDGVVLFGRFRPDRFRSACEETLESELGDRVPQFRTRHVEGYAYTFCSRGAEETAFATLGSSTALVGSRDGVRRFLKVRAGLLPSLREDAHLAQAYDDSAARRAALWRLEKAGGPLLRSLDPIVQAAKPIHAAFFALAVRGDALQLTIRLVADSEEAAEDRAKFLQAEAGVAALRKRFGIEQGPDIARSKAVVILTASLPLAAFGEQVKKHKENPAEARTLVLDLLTQ